MSAVLLGLLLWSSHLSNAATLPLGGTTTFVNVTRFATFQDAIDATPTGGTLYIPEGHYTHSTRPAVVPMTISRQIHIVGEGVWHEGYVDSGGAIIDLDNDGSSDLVYINGGTGLSGGDADGTIIENVFFKGAYTSGGSGRGMVAKNVHHLTLRYVQFYQFPKAALTDSLGSGQSTVFWVVERCSFLRSRLANMVFLGNGSESDACIFRYCHFVNNAGVSLLLNNCVGTTVSDCVFENDVETSSATGKDGSYILWQGGDVLRVENNWFERSTTTDPPTNWFIYIDGPRTVCDIQGNYMTRTSSAITYPRWIKLADTWSAGSASGPKVIRIMSNFGVLQTTPHTPTVAGTGRDDVSMSAQCQVQMENNYLKHPNNLVAQKWWVSDSTGASLPDMGHLSRFNDSRKWRLMGTSRDTIEALVDVDNGELMYSSSSTDATLLMRQAAKWRRIASFVKATAGPPQSGVWAIGDMVYNTAGDSLYICKVAGTAPSVTWRGCAITGVP